MWAPAFLFAKGTNASPIAPPPSPGGALRSRPKPEDTSPHRTSFAGRVYLTEEICTRRPRGRALRSLSASVGIADQPPREAVATGRSRSRVRENGLRTESSSTWMPHEGEVEIWREAARAALQGQHAEGTAQRAARPQHSAAAARLMSTIRSTLPRRLE